MIVFSQVVEFIFRNASACNFFASAKKIRINTVRNNISLKIENQLKIYRERLYGRLSYD